MNEVFIKNIFLIQKTPDILITISNIEQITFFKLP